jgi:hypothetical protein
VSATLEPTAYNVLSLVKERGGGVSFVEIEGAFADAKGDHEIALDDRNVVLWQGVSYQLADAVRDAIKMGLVELSPTSPLVYAIDGKLLRLPIAKGARNYKSPRWLPVVLDLPKATRKTKKAS